MVPIADDNSDRTITSIVNYAFIGINVLVFLLLQQLGSNGAIPGSGVLACRRCWGDRCLIGFKLT